VTLYSQVYPWSHLY